MAIALGQIRLNVIDRRAVHQVTAADIKHRPLIFCIFDCIKFDAGKSHRIWPKRRPCGENPQSFIAAQKRRSDRRAPVLTAASRKLPDQPDMGKILKAAKGLSDPVFLFKDDLALDFLNEAALAGQSEFIGKIRINVCNDFHGFSLR